MVPEEAEDMWHAYNIISIGDQIKASTIRKVSGNNIENSLSFL
jgi:protein pelota